MFKLKSRAKLSIKSLPMEIGRNDLRSEEIAEEKSQNKS